MRLKEAEIEVRYCVLRAAKENISFKMHLEKKVKETDAKRLIK